MKEDAAPLSTGLYATVKLTAASKWLNHLDPVTAAINIRHVYGAGPYPESAPYTLHRAML